MKKNHLLERCWKEYSSIAVMLIYMVFYLLIFGILENRKVGYHVISFGIDGYIPFCEYFVIPYLLWFAYVAVAVLVLGIKDKEECGRLVSFLIAGMTIFLIISAVFPNGHHLRPRAFARDNFCVDLVKMLYRVDTSTNIVPSIHVYNSIGVMIACFRTKLLKNHRITKWALVLLGFSIICSTVLIKQHSMLDVMSACILSAALYSVCFKSEMQQSQKTANAK